MDARRIVAVGEASRGVWVWVEAGEHVGREADVGQCSARRPLQTAHSFPSASAQRLTLSVEIGESGFGSRFWGRAKCAERKKKCQNWLPTLDFISCGPPCVFVRIVSTRAFFYLYYSIFILYYTILYLYATINKQLPTLNKATGLGAHFVRCATKHGLYEESSKARTIKNVFRTHTTRN